MDEEKEKREGVSTEKGWKLLSPFIFRSTGFPYHWLEQLRCPASSQVADTLLTLEDPAQFQARWEEGQQTFAREAQAARFALKNILEDSRFQEATFLSSPSFFTSVQRYLARWQNDTPPSARSQSRREERVNYAYIQRLCAKNETTSFFGPVNYGEFVPAGGLAIQRAFRPGEQLGQRKIFLAYWVAKILAHEISTNREVLPFLTPRPNPLVRSTGQETLYIHSLGRSVKISQLQERTFLALDGQKTIQQIAGELELSIQEVLEALRALEKAKLVDLDLPLIPFKIDALQELRETISTLPASLQHQALSLVRQAEEHRSALERTAWPERRDAWRDAENWLAAHIPEGIRRGGGALYADRFAFYEDCQGTLAKLEIGGALYRALTGQFLTVMHLYTVAAALRWLDLQSCGKSIVARLRKEGEPLYYLDILAPLDAERPAMPLSEQFADRMRELLRRHPVEAGQEIHLTSEEIEIACAPFSEKVEEVLRHHEILLPSPDIMIAARSAAAVERGDFRLVLGELHDDCSTIFAGFFSYFHPDPEKLRAILQQALCSTTRWEHLASIVSQRRNKYITPELPGYSLLLSSVSSKETRRVIPMHQVEVREVDGYLTLWADEKPLTTYPGDLKSIAHQCFSLPCVVPLPWSMLLESTHTPRILVDGVVVQREAWTVETSQVQLPPVGSTGFPLLMHMRRLRQRYQWPEQVFVKWSAHEKPVLIDMTIPWAVEWLAHILRQAERVVLSEMNPAPQELWWEDSLGKHTFEMRTAYFYAHSLVKATGGEDFRRISNRRI